ncbi:MAG: hypothetical protein WAO58_13200 [Fimbriimonadaceae bacterium]
MKARIFALLALGIPCLAPCQDAAKQITFSAKAQDARKMLADLSKVAGMAVIADVPVRQEILLLDLKDVPLKDRREMAGGSEAGGGVRKPPPPGVRL